MLKLELRVGESLKIGDAIITLEEKSGKVARLAIEAAKSVPIHRVDRPTMAQIAAKTRLAPLPA